MKKLNLNHEYTPNDLVKLNSQIESVLSAAELDNELLKQLIIQRDEKVIELLDSLEGTNRTKSSKCELKSNEQLLSHVESHFRDALKELSGLIKGRKSVNKYV